MKDKMRIKYVSILLLAGFMFCGCSSRREPIDSMVKSLTVPAKTLLAITNGESFETIKSTLGIAARHEFTAAESNGDYTLISCYFAGGDNALWLLFRNKILIKVIEPFSFPELLETYPYEGTTASRIKSWDIDDPEIEERIKKVIDAPALTHGQISDELHSNTNTTSGSSWNIIPALLLPGIMGKMASQIEKDYEVNENLFKHYDGCQAKLGMSVADIKMLYGNPLRVVNIKNGETAQIYGYGETRELQVNPQLAFRGLAIVIDTKGQVTAIYSDGFFSNEWKE